MFLTRAALALLLQQTPATDAPTFTHEQVRGAGAVAGLEFSEAELALMEKDVGDAVLGYRRLFAVPIDNAIDPAFTFDPLLPGMRIEARAQTLAPLALPEVQRPKDLEELAFADIATLASLVKSKRVSCVELTKSFLARARRLDGVLHAVINFTEERALKQAAVLDQELAAGKWRGPLHGLPWGAKDLFAVKGTPTTWGSKIYEHQMLDADAAVVQRLDAAGAVLICKTTLGEFAYGDLWFGGRTRTPWNTEKGSSGSSAGSCSLVAAGGLAFALGTETLGSIVSPCTACGSTGIRPTFGRVPRTGAMNLCWSMDKIGPIARSALDAALVLEVIAGPDGHDPAVRFAPFHAGLADVKGWKVGYLAQSFEKTAADRHVLDELRALGVELVPLDLPREVSASDLLVILTAEAATAFDELTRDGRDEQMVWQESAAWPNTFRAARLIPAVEYLRASRLRTQLMRRMDETLGDLVAYVHPSNGGGSLTITNLTGHPCVVLPASEPQKDGAPRSITFTGRLYREEELVALAAAWQRSTTYHLAHPKL